MRTLFALALLAVVSPAAPVPKPKTPPDAEQLVGTWKVAAVNGNTSHGGSHTFVFDKEGACRTVYGDDNKNVAEWSWKIEAEESPRRMTLTRTGRSGPPAYDCVYALDGDSLKIAFPASGKGRPAKVEAGADVILYELRRDPSAK